MSFITKIAFPAISQRTNTDVTVLCSENFPTILPSALRLWRPKLSIFQLEISLFCKVQFYGGPQVHTKFKSLTLYSNHSRRIQIAHTKNQIFTPNSKTLAPNSNHPHQKSNLHTEFKNTRTKFKSLTPKIRSSHRIQITHTEFKNTRTKFKSLTPKIKSSHRIQITHTEFKNTRTKFKVAGYRF